MSARTADDLKVDPEHFEKEVELADNEVSWTPEEEKKLVRRIDLFLLPTIWFVPALRMMSRAC